MADELAAIIVPIIDFDFVEGVLEGTINLPLYQIDEEVSTINHDTDYELDGCPEQSSSNIPILLHSERDEDEQLRHTTYENDVNGYCNCAIAPFFCYQTGLYADEAHGDFISDRNIHPGNGHVHTELGPKTSLSVSKDR